MSSFINPRAEGHANDNAPLSPESYKGYALSGKIMLTAIVILFLVVILMVSLSLYARWYLLRERRRTRRTRILFRHDNETYTAARDGAGGLDKEILNSLPVFVYKKESSTATAAMECAVCLSEFEDSETGRVLPKCNHTFHTECIDMWFHSHATCPLCRCAVEPPRPDDVSHVVLDVCNEEASSGSGSGSGSGSRRKPMEIVVPSREGRSELESPLPSAYWSPMSRVLSLTRMLSRERRIGGDSPSGNNASCSSVAELDIERGPE